MKPGFKINLQQDIANNRRNRENKQLVEFDPFDEDAPVPESLKSSMFGRS